MDTGPKFAERISAASFPEQVSQTLKQMEAVALISRMRKESGLMAYSSCRNVLLVDFPHADARSFAELYAEICREYTEFSELYVIRLADLVKEDPIKTYYFAKEVFDGLFDKVVFIEDTAEFFTEHKGTEEEAYILNAMLMPYRDDPNHIAFVVPTTSELMEGYGRFREAAERLHPTVINFN
jgi:hypothetical protein